MASYLEFDIGIVTLTEYDKDKFPTAQVNVYGEAKSGVAPYEVHSPHGLISRCHDPVVDAAGTHTLGCTALYALDGGQGHLWMQSDPRIIPLLPPIRKGGTCSYGGKLKNPSFYNIDGDTGSQTIYVPYKIINDVATKAMTIEVNVDTEGKESISIVHGSGAAIMIVEDNGEVSVTIKNKDGSAYVEVTNEGTTINGPLTVNGSMNAGGPVGALPMAMAIPTVASLAAIQAQLASMVPWLTAIASAGGTPPSLVSAAPLMATSAAAITAGTIAVAASAPIIPAKNTSGM